MRIIEKKKLKFELKITSVHFAKKKSKIRTNRNEKQKIVRIN